MVNSIPSYLFAGYSNMQKKKEPFYASCSHPEMELSFVVNLDFMGSTMSPEGPVDVAFLKSAVIKDGELVDTFDYTVAIDSWQSLGVYLKNRFSKSEKWVGHDNINNDTVCTLIRKMFSNEEFEELFNDILESYPNVTIH